MDEDLSKILEIEDEAEGDYALLELIKRAAEAQDLEKVLEIQAYISGTYEKALGFIEAAKIFARSNNLDLAQNLFDKGAAAALSADEEWQQTELLARIGKEMAGLYFLDKAGEIWNTAIDIAQKGQNEGDAQGMADCNSVLGEIAQYQHEAGLIEAAQQTIEKISNPGKRDSVRSRLK